MDAGARDVQDSREVLDGGVDQKMSEKPKNSVVWSVVETVIVIESEEGVCVIGKNEDLEALDKDLGSNKAVLEGVEKLNEKEACGQRGTLELGTNKNLNHLVDGNASETLVVSNSDETARAVGDNRKLVANVDELGSSKVVVEESKKKVPQAEKDSHVIDMKCESGRGCGDRWDGESVCRICHLSADQSPDRKTETTTSYAPSDLIPLGCECKDELGVAHSHCAEAWFKLKGNRMCEICGQTAKNITGQGDSRFMEEWNEAALAAIANNTPDSNGACWRGHPFCNFLMACLVIAFVLPWFFRVNMF